MIVDVLPVLATLMYLVNGSPISTAQTITPSLDVPEDIQRAWGPYTPWFAAEAYQAPAQGCSVTQVRLMLHFRIYILSCFWIGQHCMFYRFVARIHHVECLALQIQRHGARFPTSGASKRITAALAKIQGVSNYTDTRLDFLKTYKYDLGVADLVPFGAAQCVSSRNLRCHTCTNGTSTDPSIPVSKSFNVTRTS